MYISRTFKSKFFQAALYIGGNMIVFKFHEWPKILIMPRGLSIRHSGLRYLWFWRHRWHFRFLRLWRGSRLRFRYYRLFRLRWFQWLGHIWYLGWRCTRQLRVRWHFGVHDVVDLVHYYILKNRSRKLHYFGWI